MRERETAGRERERERDSRQRERESREGGRVVSLCWK